MAEEQDSGQERTEEPTPKRLKEAREKGQVPRSRELTMTLVMLVGAGTLYGTGTFFAGRIRSIFGHAFRIEREHVFDEGFMGERLVAMAADMLVLISPLLLLLLVTALMAPALLGGWVFSFKAIQPKGDKLDPVKGLKRVFGSKGLMELLKAMGKFLVVAACALVFFWVMAEHFLGLGRMAIEEGIGSSAGLVILALAMMSAALILISAIDVPFQIHSYKKQVRMTRQEVRDELKQTEGRPEVRGKIRELQQETARRRMMQDVPRADVVITNPTHFAVALRYDDGKMAAPVVVAKGVEAVALRIREIAAEHKVPQLEAPPLARVLYRSVDIGHAIPPELYVAVAEVLTWVYRIRHRSAGSTAPPPPNPDVSALESS
ncbi:MAG: flagellar biosynthesis protein FlhB [Wenzhouxiangellaceae bacterium]|nr:flagellar biosynthesis protein FlhB [Wenzhouxiangellaceae bacterium]